MEELLDRYCTLGRSRLTLDLCITLTKQVPEVWARFGWRFGHAGWRRFGEGFGQDLGKVWRWFGGGGGLVMEEVWAGFGGGVWNDQYLSLKPNFAG